MTEALFERVLLPVADVEDAHSTTRAAVDYLPEDADVLALHVLEDGRVKSGTESKKTLMTVEAVLEDSGMRVETHQVSADDVVDAIHSAAEEVDATCIAFTPGEPGGLLRTFDGDVTEDLVDLSNVPVLVMPDVPEHERRR